ncbi:MAG TPA: class I SAM-dependent methyltransferase [Blastocatellia bacterium]
MSSEKELAYRYDLFVSPQWRGRYDALISDNLEIPLEGAVLDVNCGTGAYAVALAGLMKDKGGDVVALDPSDERLELARARAQVLKTDNIEFKNAASTDIPFRTDRFDAVIGDASMLSRPELEATLSEMIRVAGPDARVVLKIAARGSFDEFFSVYWEALHDSGLDDESGARLETMINTRITTSEAEAIARAAGLKNIQTVSSKEEFLYESGEEFLNSPLITDYFLDEWLAIVPEDQQSGVKQRIVEIVDRERRDGPFDLSIKATLVYGVK